MKFEKVTLKKWLLWFIGYVGGVISGTIIFKDAISVILNIVVVIIAYTIFLLVYDNMEDEK